MSEWRPIESAPKDGTEVLLFEPGIVVNRARGRGYIFVGEYRYGNWDCSEYDAFGHYPTHWMPLPAPPEDE